ncbi:MAG: GDSL-type esterase/lipase family protein [Armatimonadetes bacterium]|nr:GDSL-type esterase/lipase family protein [Armatimonadota bacterium]
MKTIVCIGDSITQSFRDTDIEHLSYPARLQNLLAQRGLDVRVVNRGIGGECADSGARRFASHVLSHNPAAVTIMYGANDQFFQPEEGRCRNPIDDYEASLRSMVNQAAQIGAKAVLMTPPPFTRAFLQHLTEDRVYSIFGASVLLGQYADRVRVVARDMAVPVVDMYASFIRLSLDGADMDALMPDGVHPAPEAHKYMAEWMVDTVAEVLA